MKKIDISKSLIFGSTVEDVKNSLEYLDQEGYFSNSKAVFIEEEPKKKKLRQFKSIEEFFKVTGFKIGDIVQIQKFGNYCYEEKSIFSGVRVYIDEEFHRKDAIIGASTHSFDELFKHYKYFKNGEWLRFGVEE